MSFSKMMADRLMIDLKSIVLTMWDSAYLLRNGKKDEKAKAKTKLIELKGDIERIEDESFFEESLHTYYHTDIKISDLHKYLSRIEKGDLEDTAKQLEALNSELTEKFSENFRTESLKRQYI